MSDEDLQRNVFWLALNSKTHAALYHSVAQHRLIVCVPVQASMPAHVVLDKYYLGEAALRFDSTLTPPTESHIFEASQFFLNEYISVNKKTVELKEKTIETKRGYPEKRAVHVLAEESFYSSQKE
jgi:hypothetical protein